MTPTRLFIVGPGRLGCSLGRALSSHADYRVSGVVYHSEAGRQRAGRWLPEVTSFAMTGYVGLDEADVIVLTVLDDVIESTALALQPYLTSAHILFHTSGLFSSEIFRNLDLPCPAGSFHPLQTFADPEFGRQRFRGCTIACEGDDEAVRRARHLAEALGARSVVLRAVDKPFYHAAAAIASNFLVVLTHVAVRLLASAGIEPQTAIAMLQPLQRGTLDNLHEIGVPQALTGPIARGDVRTLEAHLKAISTATPELEATYCQLARHALALAGEMGLSAEKTAEIEALLERSKGPELPTQ